MDVAEFFIPPLCFRWMIIFFIVPLALWSISFVSTGKNPENADGSWRIFDCLMGPFFILVLSVAYRIYDEVNGKEVLEDKKGKTYFSGAMLASTIMAVAALRAIVVTGHDGIRKGMECFSLPLFYVFTGLLCLVYILPNVRILYEQMSTSESKVLRFLAGN
jgi:hypothetical protein